MTRLIVATDPRHLAQFEYALSERYKVIYVFDDDHARSAAATVTDGIVANVHFDDGAVFQFISFIRGAFPNMPVIAVNPAIDDRPINVATAKAFEIATRSVGAWDYIDFNIGLPPEGGLETAQDCLRQRIDALLKGEERASVARQDRRMQGHDKQNHARGSYSGIASTRR